MVRPRPAGSEVGTERFPGRAPMCVARILRVGATVRRVGISHPRRSRRSPLSRAVREREPGGVRGLQRVPRPSMPECVGTGSDSQA